jgi:hypothetical protein
MTQRPAVATSLEAALFGIYPIASPVERIRDAIAALRSRREARRGYRYLLDHAAARRDAGLSTEDVRRALGALR